jgi:hypothetical protein
MPCAGPNSSNRASTLWRVFSANQRRSSLLGARLCCAGGRLERSGTFNEITTLSPTGRSAGTYWTTRPDWARWSSGPRTLLQPMARRLLTRDTASPRTRTSPDPGSSGPAALRVLVMRSQRGLRCTGNEGFPGLLPQTAQVALSATDGSNCTQGNTAGQSIPPLATQRCHADRSGEQPERGSLLVLILRQTRTAATRVAAPDSELLPLTSAPECLLVPVPAETGPERSFLGTWRDDDGRLVRMPSTAKRESALR